MKKALSSIALAILFCSCSKTEQEIAGTYVKYPTKYTIDTLFIYADSLQNTYVEGRKVYKYKQRFYNKKNKQLLFENNSTWYLTDGKILLQDLYFDADNDPAGHTFSKERLKHAVISFHTEMDGEDIWIEKGIDYKRVK